MPCATLCTRPFSDCQTCFTFWIAGHIATAQEVWVVYLLTISKWQPACWHLHFNCCLSSNQPASYTDSASLPFLLLNYFWVLAWVSLIAWMAWLCKPSNSPLPLVWSLLFQSKLYASTLNSKIHLTKYHLCISMVAKLPYPPPEVGGLLVTTDKKHYKLAIISQIVL